jgi:NADH:ubiquinone oxidoreductase subunit 6 (subunit J)
MALSGLLIFGGLLWIIPQMPQSGAFAGALPAGDMVFALGKSLVDTKSFALVFEGSSVLLLAALIGAVMVAGGARGQEPSSKDSSTKNGA